MSEWRIYKGEGIPIDVKEFPQPPSWRVFTKKEIKEDETQTQRVLEYNFKDTKHLTFTEYEKEKFKANFEIEDDEIDLINAALYLRRPLLITGKPGTGKSSLAYAVAYELQLGPVLRWPITTRSSLQEGLYRYDAMARLEAANLEVKGKQQDISSDIGKFIQLGALGTAFLPSKKPRVLLIDEIDKSDIDLPNDLLNIFEEGEFEISELVRLSKHATNTEIDHSSPINILEPFNQTNIKNEFKIRPYDAKDPNDKVSIINGHITCSEFPFIVMTSNKERDFPAPFLRRCLQLEIKSPDEEKLKKIIEKRLGENFPEADKLINIFLEKCKNGDLATDQLFNAVYLTKFVNLQDKKALIDNIMQYIAQ